MGRFIDTLPDRTEIRRKKVIVLSSSRSGTFGLYKSLAVLGYRPYHMVEMLRCGLDHLKMCYEGLEAYENPTSGAKQYGRREFDKWLADYDALIEVPSYFGTNVIDAYIGDPDIKFILTERTPESFAKSLMKTAGMLYTASDRLPLSLFKQFDAYNRTNFDLSKLCFWRWSGGRHPDDPDAMQAMADNYSDYIATVKKVVPPERLLVLQLDGGINWETLCPFLGRPIPSVPYLPGNDPEEFKKIAMKYITPGIIKAQVIIGVPIVAGLAGLAWYLLR